MSMVLERALAILELNHAGMNLQEACDIVGVQVNSYTKSKSVLAKVVPDKYVRIIKHFTQEEIDDVINESKRRGVSLVQVCDERDINYQTLTTRAYSLAGNKAPRLDAIQRILLVKEWDKSATYEDALERVDDRQLVELVVKSRILRDKCKQILEDAENGVEIRFDSFQSLDNCAGNKRKKRKKKVNSRITCERCKSRGSCSYTFEPNCKHFQADLLTFMRKPE